MSGPVTSADAEPAAGDGPNDQPAETRAVEVMDARRARVGDITVQRALPQRPRRTVGAWCFCDLGEPRHANAGVGGIGPHPHIGLQTVTWMLDGELLHRDSLGSEQPIRPGQLNLMTAGRGIVHAEEHPRAGTVRLAQLWVAQPDGTRFGEPAFEHHAELPQHEFAGATVTVLIGAIADARSPARRDTDHVGADVALHAGDATLPANRDYEYAVIPLDGTLAVDGRTVEPGRLVYLGPGRDEIALRTDGAARALLLGGVPFGERVLMWWNYVARTRDEVSAAHRDWSTRTERFGLPDSTLAPIDVPRPPWEEVGDAAGS